MSMIGTITILLLVAAWAFLSKGSLPEVLTGTASLVAVSAIYFLPLIIAEKRKHRNRGAIAALNLFLGWTFIGWVVALVWALTDNTEECRGNLPQMSKARR